MAITNTDICNMSLSKLGANSISDLDTDKSVQGVKCRLHYEQTRDALIRSHYWRFASGRAALVQDTTDPDFEYDSQFILPEDFSRLKNVFGDNGSPSGNLKLTFAIEGNLLLTNETAINLRYIKKVTDPTKFDELFIEVLILKLALKLVSLAGANSKMTATLGGELQSIMPQVRALDRQETNTIGRLNRRPWVEARVSSRSATVGDRVVG